MCLDPSKRITVDEALSSQWFSDQVASDALTVGGSDVRGLMKEWNARRAVLKLTNLRAKGAAHPKKEGDAAASSSGGTGPIGAIKGLMRRGSGTADDIAAGVAAADLGGSPAGAAKLPELGAARGAEDKSREQAISERDGAGPEPNQDGGNGPRKPGMTKRSSCSGFSCRRCSHRCSSTA